MTVGYNYQGNKKKDSNSAPEPSEDGGGMEAWYCFHALPWCWKS